MKRFSIWIVLAGLAMALMGCGAQVSEQQAKEYGMTPEEKAAGQKPGQTADSER